MALGLTQEIGLEVDDYMTKKLSANAQGNNFPFP